MSMQRTNVYADADDLALIKEGAARLGVSEAEIIRRGIRIAALSVRTWDEPFFADEDLIPMGGRNDREGRRQTIQEHAARRGGDEA
ncbi:ribbon-helix-helix protein, CopG family [Streptomyces sp. TRM72054]|uniref:ribbon-helix-helix protein, CopG family n=1 Tax=Streptomyces sp. TRM72054 TaxID=2870562 RepID=UPI001C8B7FCF|nr:ribbon-helix-helix protein, CopG family [Streptomyces sp. TRM72054]MBX9394942.1 ribbon-helix-helix protein, CopG family [Streptomyces sp. TRM72054]